MNNLSHIKWDTFLKTLAFTESDWTVVDITGSTIIFSLKDKVNDETARITENWALTDAVNWEATILIDNDTMNIDVGNYYYDIEWTDWTWIVRTVIKWKFTITNDIT